MTGVMISSKFMVVPPAPSGEPSARLNSGSFVSLTFLLRPFRVVSPTSGFKDGADIEEKVRLCCLSIVCAGWRCFDRRLSFFGRVMPHRCKDDHSRRQPHEAHKADSQQREVGGQISDRGCKSRLYTETPHSMH